tara:strand:- start:394 stop:672 length:279 start_codon:yes stop_codon:yes gene_type:complete
MSDSEDFEDFNDTEPEPDSDLEEIEDDLEEIDENKTPSIRYLMNLFIFVTLCGSVYLLFLYIKEAKKNNAVEISKPQLNVANAEISTTTQTD